MTQVFFSKISGFEPDKALLSGLFDGEFGKSENNSSVCARLLLAYAVKSKNGFPLKINKNGYGKPAFEDLPLQFNLSHSESWVCCAVSESPVGVDIQVGTTEREGVAKRFFSAAENSWLDSLNKTERGAAFFDLWSVKESYIKAVGKGLAMPLSGFTADLGSSVRVISDGNVEYGFGLYAVAPDCRIAVCLRGGKPDCEPVFVPMANVLRELS